MHRNLVYHLQVQLLNHFRANKASLGARINMALVFILSPKYLRSRVAFVKALLVWLVNDLTCVACDWTEKASGGLCVFDLSGVTTGLRHEFWFCGG